MKGFIPLPAFSAESVYGKWSKLQYVSFGHVYTSIRYICYLLELITAVIITSMQVCNYTWHNIKIIKNKSTTEGMSHELLLLLFDQLINISSTMAIAMEDFDDC